MPRSSRSLRRACPACPDLRGESRRVYPACPDLRGEPRRVYPACPDLRRAAAFATATPPQTVTLPPPQNCHPDPAERDPTFLTRRLLVRRAENLSSRPQRTGFFLHAVFACRFAQWRDRFAAFPHLRSSSWPPSVISVFFSLLALSNFFAKGDLCVTVPLLCELCILSASSPRPARRASKGRRFYNRHLRQQCVIHLPHTKYSVFMFPRR